MAGLWVNDPATPEGKYPVVLRRDGTQVEFQHFLINAHDPGFSMAMHAYAAEHERLGSDPAYVQDCRSLATTAERGFLVPAPRPSDPDAPRHRQDDPLALLFARTGWSLDDFVMWAVGVSRTSQWDGARELAERLRAAATAAISDDGSSVKAG